MTILHASNIVVSRGPRRILDIPEFKVGVEDRHLLLGPSGCGKTTLLSVLAGMMTPDSGTVMIDGQNISTMKPRQRDRFRGRAFGFVFQTLHLLPALTLRQNVALASTMAGLKLDERRLDDLLGRLGLADKADRKPDALSQGEMQRAAIARAVLNRPKIILADEPTSALDDANAEIVTALLTQQAQESNAALVVATHDRRIVDKFNTVLFLNDMKVAA